MCDEQEKYDPYAFAHSKHNKSRGNNGKRFSRKEERKRHEKIQRRNTIARTLIRDQQVKKPNAFDLTSGINLVREVHKYFPKERDDWHVFAHHAENVLLLGYGLYKCTSVSDAVHALMSFAKMYTQRSITCLMKDFIEILAEESPPDTEDILSPFEDDESLVPHALDWARHLVDGWKLFKNHEIFPKLSYLISAVLSMSVCSIKEIDFQLCDVSLVHVEALKTQICATDLMDAVINTFDWICETGAACLAEKSLFPILFSDQHQKQWQLQCDKIFGNSSAALNGNLEDLSMFERELDECIATTGRMQKVCKKSVTSELLQRKYVSLMHIKEQLVNRHRGTSIRFAPLGISIFGTSAVGKSTASALTMKHCLHHMEFSTDKSGIVTLREGGKHDDLIKSDTLGVYIDDVGNTKSQFVQDPISGRLITMFNNVACQALKAELHEKGCVFYNFKVGVLTTNVKNLDANLYSNHPSAVLRRFVHVTMRVKPEYRVAGGTALNTDHPIVMDARKNNRIADVWEFDVDECIPNEDTYWWRVATYEKDGQNRLCKSMGLEDYLNVMERYSRSHKIKQENTLAADKQIAEVQYCPTCDKLPQFCLCKSCEMVPNARDFVDDLADVGASMVVRTGKHLLNRSLGLFFAPLSVFDVFGRQRWVEWTSKECATYVEEYILRHPPELLTWVPHWIYFNPFVTYWFNKWCGAHCIHKASRSYWKFAVIFLLLVLPTLRYGWIPFCIATLLWFFFCLIVFIGNYNIERNVVREMMKRLEQDRDAIGEEARAWRDGYAVRFGAVALGVGMICCGLRMWNTARKADPPQGLDDPTHADRQPGWFGYAMESLGMKVTKDNCPKTSTPSHIQRTIEKNCWSGLFHRDTGVYSECNVFIPRKSVLLFPLHMFYAKGDMTTDPCDKMDITLSCGNDPGQRFSVKVHRDCVYHFPEMDLVAAYAPNCPDIKSAYKWFPSSLPTGGIMAHLVRRMPSKEIVCDNICVKFRPDAGHSYMKFHGGDYGSKLCVRGACMSPIVSETKQPCIVGLHIAGNEVGNSGSCISVTSRHLTDAFAWVDKNVAYLSAETGVIPKTQYGVPILTSDTIHPHAKYIHGMDSRNFVNLIGSTKLRSAQKTDVMESPISKALERETGLANEWGGPQFHPNWDAYNKNIEKFSQPGDMFDPPRVQRAADDYIEPLLTKMEAWVELEDFRPLTMEENCMGIAGKRFIDALPMNTSMGFPLYGKKNKLGEDGERLYFEEEREGEKLMSRRPTKVVLDEMERLMKCWRNNERAYPISSATLKDEPTKIGKTKVRVFQASTVALSLAIRKYFLPIARFLQCHPLLSEMAVGVNAFSPDWEEMMNHAQKFTQKDKEKMLGWDYSSFDVRMHSQITRTAWEILIKLAEKSGKYSSDDIQIMKAMIVDICHPLMAINGTLMMAFNMNTSGNNMTVVVNGIAGSLYVRMGFMHVYPLYSGDMRSVLAVLTYGDDLNGSVHEDYENFNFLSFREFLGEHGMMITPPDKEAKIEKPFLDADECDFLKRKSAFVDGIPFRIGALDKRSIIKSLHANLKSSSQTPLEVSAQCIETAMHEFFAHGRQEYENWRTILTKVSNECGLCVPCLKYDFEDRVRFWHEKYLTEAF